MRLFSDGANGWRTETNGNQRMANGNERMNGNEQKANGWRTETNGSERKPMEANGNQPKRAKTNGIQRKPMDRREKLALQGGQGGLAIALTAF